MNDSDTLSAMLNRVFCMDALELLRRLPDDSIDITVTSPPYNLGTQINGAESCSRSASNWGKSALLSAGYDTFDDAMPYDAYIAWQKEVLTECYRVSKKAVFYNQKWRIQAGLLDRRDGITNGLPVRQIIIWHRGSGLNHNKAFFNPQYEVLYYIPKPSTTLIQKYASSYGDVWRLDPEYDNPHPAPFPEILPERCILATDAQSVLDPFGGSGTVAVVAQRLGCDFITGDISPTYCDMMRRRLSQPFTLPMLFEETEAAP